MIELAFRLFAMDIVKNDLGFFLARKAVSKQAAQHLIAHENALIKELAKYIDPILASFNVPLEQLHVPIAVDYQKYFE